MANRRSGGHRVRYVYGLNRCLKNCEVQRDAQGNVTSRAIEYDFTFAKAIDGVAKAKFEPDHGGDYQVFQSRPLDPAILVYAAHDVRYMMALYDYFTEKIKVNEATCKQANPKHVSWFNRVMLASAQRVEEFNSELDF